MIGKEILNYRIVSLIGKGGMGSVYLAEHMLISNEKVAIKVINADMANDFTRKLLKEEAEHLAELKHHNIVAFKNYHIDGNGNIYLIMEYAEGKSLEDYINSVSGLIVESRICPIFEPILDAVGYAHKKHIIHRDIKPSNIVLMPDGTPKILDFGIAQIIKNNGEERSDEMIMGTPSYMSPEQVKGEPLDERSDIYSLGVLLHQMLTGNAPYDTTTLTEHEINTKIVEEELPRMRTYYKYISDGVQKVVDKATAKDPANRYASCDEFKKALHRAIYPWRPKKWMVAASVAVLVALLAIGGYFWDANRTKVSYYKDYVEQWGVPVGIGKLSSSQHHHAARAYKFVTKKGKVLQVSHVNGYDYLIDDGESERNERPVDQYMTYNSDGKISRIEVKDRSGKTLYVKSFNDKLNTMIFQYADEHGTECTISNSTVGYGGLFGEGSADGATNGRISRWWIEYDENGYVTGIKYAGMDNSQVGDENGIFGRRYVHDSKGRITEIHYLGMNGEPQPTKWGLGIKKFYYDDKDNWVKAEYLTVDGKPALDDADGVAVYCLDYDKYGNETAAYYQDENGKPAMPRKHYISGMLSTYDDHGLCIKRVAIGTDGNPIYIKGQGYSGQELEYDKHGYIAKVTYLNPEGEVVATTDGNASTTYVNDDKGNSLEVWNFDTNGQLCECTSDGYAGLVSEYDSIGNVLKVMTYGVDKKPCVNSSGDYGMKFEYNALNLRSKVSYLDAAGNVNAKSSVPIRINEYDKRGNLTSVKFFKADGKTPAINSEGVAGWSTSFDDYGRVVSTNYFDAAGKPTINRNTGYAKVVYKYDNNGYVSSARFYGPADKLVLTDSGAGYDNINDARGNVIQNTPIGTDGQLASGSLISKFKYDAYDNVIEQALYSSTGKALNSDNTHRYEYVYNSRNQVVEERHYDVVGNLTLSASGHYAIAKTTYNSRGDRTTLAYFGTDNKPCKSAEGWSSATYEVDAFGHVVKQCFFDVNGKPTDVHDMVPVGIAKYDRWGNQIFLASQDGAGRYIINPAMGCAITRLEFDPKGNKLFEAYYNEADKPMNGKNGFHKATYKYDALDRQIEAAYFDASGKPVVIAEGYHLIKAKYHGTTGDIEEMSYYDASGKPTNITAGWHRLVKSYSDNNELVKQTLYDAAGKVVASVVWNGQSWVSESSRPEQPKGADTSPAFEQSAPSSGNALTQLQSVVAEANTELPLKAADGAVLRRLYIEGDYVVALVRCDEEIIDISTLNSNKSELKSAVIDGLSNTGIDALIKAAVKANKGLSYKYVGDTTGATCTIYISVKELRRL